MYHKQLIRPVIKAWVKRIYNKKPMSLRKGIGFCQQSEKMSFLIFTNYSSHNYKYGSFPL